jgi:general secretion pathway protein H
MVRANVPSCGCRERDGSAGFTIMELMIVVAIFGLLMAGSVLTFRNIAKSDLRSAAMHTAAAMRFSFDRATMTGNTIRLAIDVDKGEIWAEVSEDRVTLRSGKDQHVTTDGKAAPTEVKAKKQPMLPFFGGPGPEGAGAGSGESEASPGLDMRALTEQWEADKAPVSRARAQFKPLKTLLARRIKMGKGISVSAVVTPRSTDPVEKGLAYVYFFPQGHAEPAIIHFVDRSEDYYSVVLHPLTGSAKVYPCMYRIPSDFGVSDDKRARSQLDPCVKKGGL